MKTEITKETVQSGEILPGVLLCPYGDFPKGETVQVCDSKAFANLVANWDADGQKEILCDFEHASEVERIDSDTKAAAWISNLQVTDEGLVGDLKFTDLGAEAVSNRRLRFLSPVWTLDGENRPEALKSVALTNKPNIKGKPVLNKVEVEGGEKNLVTQKKDPNMDKIKAALGLAPEASDEEVAAKVAELKAANEALNKEKEAAECARKEAEAEAFAEDHKACANKEDIKRLYLANKEETVKLFASLKKPEAPKQQILNKDGAKEPKMLNKATREAMAALPPAQRAAFYQEHAAEIDG